MNEALRDLITYILPAGAAGSVLTWLVNRPKRRNDFIADLQQSINLLSEEYSKQIKTNLELTGKVMALLDEVAGVRRENTQLLAGQEELKRENQALREEVNSLREQLSGIKTITKTK